MLFIKDAKDLPIMAKWLLNSAAMSLISVIVEFLQLENLVYWIQFSMARENAKHPKLFSDCFYAQKFCCGNKVVLQDSSPQSMC